MNSMRYYYRGIVRSGHPCLDPIVSQAEQTTFSQIYLAIDAAYLPSKTMFCAIVFEPNRRECLVV